MSISIRKALPSDIQTIVELTQKIAEFEKATFISEGKKEKLSSFLFGDSPRLYCLLAQSENYVSGFATYSIEFSLFEAENYMRLNCLFIEEPFRKQGIGKLFITELQKEARYLNCKSIRFFTPQFNTAAINFYHQMGATSKESIRFYLDSKQE